MDLKDSKSTEKYQKVISLVKDILSLNRKLLEIHDKRTVEQSKIDDQIKKINEEIDHEIYSFYGLTEEEIDLIEA